MNTTIESGRSDRPRLNLPSGTAEPVALLVNNSTLATATYGQGSTTVSVAAALAASAASAPNSPVKVTAVDDGLYLQATTAGAAGNAITYSLQNTAYSSTNFSAPSFPAATSSGTLSGGADQGTNNGQVVYQYNTQFDSANNLTSDIDQVMGTWGFQYDTLNRLMGATANETGNPNTNYCWGYDSFGNRTIQAGSNAAFQVGSPSCTPAGTASYTGTWAHYSSANNNRLDNTSQAVGGVSYDASGDVVNDGLNQYLYDGEGRICAVASTPVSGDTILTGYVYNASGERVSKGTITTWSCDPAINGFSATNDYVLGPNGEQVTEMAMNANNTMAWQHTNVYAAGKLFATYDSDGLHFYFNDVVGTRRVQTDYAGVLEQSCSGLPFGDSLSCTNSIQFPTEHHFTGKERDFESGNDYFGARYYASSMGRFLSPDWSSNPENVPYANRKNPQSLNLYGYVGNNPLSMTDTDGHAGCPSLIFIGLCNLFTDLKNKVLHGEFTTDTTGAEIRQLDRQEAKDRQMQQKEENQSPKPDRGGRVRAAPQGQPPIPIPDGQNNQPNTWIPVPGTQDKPYGPRYRPKFPVPGPQPSAW